MTALEELLEMEKDRDERIKKIDDLLCRAVHEEGERLGTELLEKMKDGKFGYAEVLAHDAGYSTSYSAMCDLASDHQGNTYDRIQTLMEEEVWRYRLPCDIRNLVREWNFKYDLDEDTSAEDIDNLEREIGWIALEYVMFDIEDYESTKDYESQSEIVDDEPINHNQQQRDVIEFKQETFTFGPEREPSDVVAIYVNAKSFIDIITEEEQIIAEKAGERGGGGYVWMRDWELFDELTEVQDLNSEDYYEPRILDCRCGCCGCWPLHVKISETDDTVIWSGFFNPHNADKELTKNVWDYSVIRPYCFDKKQYREELLKLYQWIAKDTKNEKVKPVQQNSSDNFASERCAPKDWNDYHADKTCGFVAHCPAFNFGAKYEEEDGGSITISPGCGSTRLYIADIDFYIFQEAITFATGQVFDNCGFYEFSYEQWHNILETGERLLHLRNLEEVLDFAVQRKIVGLKDQFGRPQYIYVANLMRTITDITHSEEKKKYLTQLSDMKQWTKLVLKENDTMNVGGL